MSADTYINQKWFVSEQPWFPAQCVGLMILAGSADGNAGHVIADQSMLASIGADNEHMPSDDQLRETARHIVEIHNDWHERQARGEVAYDDDFSKNLEVIKDSK